MIDDLDASGSTLRLLVSQALKDWKTESLLKIIFDDDYIVRTSVARELHLRGEKIIYEKSIMLLDDDRDFVREIGAFILGQLGAPNFPYREETKPYLVKLLQDRSAEVRATAAAALGHLCYDVMSTLVEQALLKKSADEDKDVRSCVAYALGNSSGSPTVLKTLNNLSEDNDPDVRSYAELGLDILRDKGVKMNK